MVSVFVLANDYRTALPIDFNRCLKVIEDCTSPGMPIGKKFSEFSSCLEMVMLHIVTELSQREASFDAIQNFDFNVFPLGEDMSTFKEHPHVILKCIFMSLYLYFECPKSKWVLNALKLYIRVSFE